MTRPQLHIVIGKSAYDCAQHAANRNLSSLLVYIYDDATLAKHPKLPADAVALYTDAFIADPNTDIVEGVAKAIGVEDGKLTLLGFLGVWYPTSAIKFISVNIPITVTLVYGMSVQIQAKSILIDRHGIHVLEGEIIDAN